MYESKGRRKSLLPGRIGRESGSGDQEIRNLQKTKDGERMLHGKMGQVRQKLGVQARSLHRKLNSSVILAWDLWKAAVGDRFGRQEGSWYETEEVVLHICGARNNWRPENQGKGMLWRMGRSLWDHNSNSHWDGGVKLGQWLWRWERGIDVGKTLWCGGTWIPVVFTLPVIDSSHDNRGFMVFVYQNISLSWSKPSKGSHHT